MLKKVGDYQSDIIPNCLRKFVQIVRKIYFAKDTISLNKGNSFSLTQ